MRRIILNADAMRAADTNGNGSITVTDMVITASVLLERLDSFPGGQSWLFEPATVELDPENAPSFISISGIKLGDTSGNVDPKSN